MKNLLYIILIIAVVAIIIILGKNLNSIKKYFSSNENEPVKCKDDEQLTALSNGEMACIPKEKEEQPVAQNELQVSNPNGAIMYYQSDLASGGKLYSPSNVVIPYGTKLKLIKTWQTNVITQPFAGYYETDDKKYGPQSGFYATQDILKL